MGMPDSRASDIDRMWDTLAATTDLANKTATNLAALSETVRAQHDRIAHVEQGPAALRGWLGVAIAAGAGCLVPFVLFAFGAVLTIVGWYLSHH